MGPIGTVSAQQALSLAAPSRLILEIDIGQLLAVLVAHDKAGFLLFNGPTACGKAAGGHSLPKSPKTIDQPAENDCTNERPDKYDEPSAPNQGASNDAEHSTDYGREL